MYNPYTDITDLIKTQNRENKSTKEQIDSILKSNTTFYKSTYSDVKSNIDKTKDYISGGEAYKDEGAQAIRASYAVSGGKAADGAAAQNAADNGGNLDTYAAAQANRAKRDFITAGEEAVAKRAESVAGNLIAADKNLISAFDTVSDAMNAGASTSQKSQAANAQNDNDLLEAAIKNLVSLYK